MACLDTTILLDATGGNRAMRKRALAKVKELIDRGQPLATTRFNVAELYVGVYRSEDPASEEQTVRKMLTGLSILDFDEKAMVLFGRITAFLQQMGRPAGDMDVLIAATAMAQGHLLVTRNAAHFRLVPNLEVETY